MESIVNKLKEVVAQIIDGFGHTIIPEDACRYDYYMDGGFGWRVRREPIRDPHGSDMFEMDWGPLDRRDMARLLALKDSWSWLEMGKRVRPK